MTRGIRIRAFAAEDLQPLIALFRTTVRTVNLGDYTPAQVAAWAPETIDADRWAVRIAAHRVWVAERDGALSGFIELGDGGHIVMLYVDAAQQRRGVATALLNWSRRRRAPKASAAFTRRRASPRSRSSPATASTRRRRRPSACAARPS